MSKRFFFSCLLAGWAASLFAQDIADTLDISEVVVTHTKSPLPLRKTVKPVFIIPASTIQRNLGRDLPQLLNEQAGILVNGAFSNPGKDKSLYLRGANADNTLILLDGQPLLDPSGLGGTFDLRLLPLEQVERIEILKGSQSTLYGTDAIGGVINIISRKTGSQPFQFFGNLAYGSLQTLKGNAGLRGKKDWLDYSASIGYQSTDGISEAEAPEPGQNFGKDGFETMNTQLKLGFQLNDRLHVQSFLRHTDYKGDFDGGAFTDADNRYLSDMLNTGVHLDWKGEDQRIQARYSFTATDRSFNATTYQSIFEGRFHNLDVWTDYQLSEAVLLIAGVNAQGAQLLDESLLQPDPQVNIISPYANLLLSVNDRWNLEAGLRYNQHSTFGSNVNTSLALSHWISKKGKVFANYTTGFKAPLLSQLYGAFGANPALDPQTSQSYELGGQWGSPNGPFFARATYFRRQIENVIAYDFTIGYFNQSEQRDQGIEIEWTAGLNERLQLSGSYTYLDGKIRAPTAGGADTTYNNLLRRPRHSFNLAVNYQVSERLLLNAGYRFLGQRDDVFFNPDNFFISELVSLEGYGLLNIYAEYKVLDQRLAIFADMKNVTDRSFTEVYGFSSLGFNFLGGLRFTL